MKRLLSAEERAGRWLTAEEIARNLGIPGENAAAVAERLLWKHGLTATALACDGDGIVFAWRSGAAAFLARTLDRIPPLFVLNRLPLRARSFAVLPANEPRALRNARPPDFGHLCLRLTLADRRRTSVEIEALDGYTVARRRSGRRVLVFARCFHPKFYRIARFLDGKPARLIPVVVEPPQAEPEPLLDFKGAW